MFSRRTIQSFLDDLSGMLPDGDLNELVLRLNNPGRDRLAAIWETIFLFAFGKVGTILHHSPLPDGRKADLTFSYQGQSDIIFVADITTISDAGDHDANPVEYFSDEFIRMVRKARLNPNHFHLQIEGAAKGAKVKLRLPDRGQVTQLLKQHVLPFLRELKTKKLAKDRRIIREPNLSVIVSYDRSQLYFGRGHLSYTNVKAVEQNPLWNALRDKAIQLRSARDVKRGVIVCDGGCDLFSGRIRTGNNFSADQIVRRFLAERSSIDFVYLITAERGHGFNSKCAFIAKGWTRNPIDTPILNGIISPALSMLPTPIVDSINAAIRAQQAGYGLGMRGGMVMGFGKQNGFVKIPSRTLLELLAGRLAPSEFDAAFGGPIDTERRSMPNPFQVAIDQGKMITAVELEHAEGQDDDWITVKFGGPDPAISPFRIKQNKSKADGQ
jgi:hypothetical protein